MSPKSFLLSDDLHAYLLGHCSPLDDVQRQLIADTAELGPVAVMQIAPEQGAFLQLFAAATGARRAIEVGTFTGYSALSLVRGMGPDGRLLCCDISEEWTAVGRRAWEVAGVADRIELRIGAGSDTLAGLPKGEVYDLAFIDADKGGYRRYYEEILTRMKPNGVILVDNVLWSGQVVDAEAKDADTVAIRTFNDHVAGDERVDVAMLPLADGLTVIRKR